MAAGTAPKKTTRPAKAATAPAAPPAAPSTGKRYTTQYTVVVTDEMAGKIQAYMAARNISQSDALREFLEYGSTQAARYTGAKAVTPAAKAKRTA